MEGNYSYKASPIILGNGGVIMNDLYIYLPVIFALAFAFVISYMAFRRTDETA